MNTTTAVALRPDVSELSQWRGALDLTARAFDQLTCRTHEWHRAISDMPFRTLSQVPGLNEGAAPTRLLHDSITDGVYGAVRLSGAAIFGGATVLLKAVERSALAASPSAPAPSINGSKLLAAVSGLVGDDMAARRNPLTPRLGFYLHNRRLTLSAEALTAAYPQATPRLAVFVHGLCCSEHVWSMYSETQPQGSPDYPARLQAMGYTPVFLRYNSGLHVSQNGRGLARALDKLVAGWPVAVEDIVLIGHSMGGLVARAAAHSGAVRNAAWTAQVSRVFCIGSPHLGAPLEQVVNVGVERMERFALSRPLARILKIRSAGIKDLRQGATHDRDWRGRDLDALGTAPRADIARIAGARYHFIGSTLSSRIDDRLSETLGDGLVNLSSATAHQVADADSASLTRVHHVRLINHPLVWQWMQTLLASGSDVRPSSPSVRSRPSRSAA